MLEKQLYSLSYSKSGEAVFFSHLDTMRILERAVRRSGVEVCYTEGCNPHIRLSVYHAVPVGVATEGDWFSMKLKEPLEPEALKQRVDAMLPPGFAIVRAQAGAPPVKERSAFHLAVHFSGCRSAATAAADALLRRTAVEVTGTRKGKPYSRDVRPFFRGYQVMDGYIRFHVEATAEAKPRLSELAEVLYDLSAGEGFFVELVRILDEPS